LYYINYQHGKYILLQYLINHKYFIPNSNQSWARPLSVFLSSAAFTIRSEGVAELRRTRRTIPYARP